MKNTCWRIALLGLLSLAAASPAMAQSCPCTIFAPSATPGTADAGEATSIEVGIKFRADVSGLVTGIRFYKSGSNVGTHIGNLWTSTGTKLATATFTNESASGWQQVNFASPVSIAANTTYIASYFAPNGHFSDDQNVFASTGIDNPPLHALANGVDGPNGVFIYSATSVFPNTTYNSSNYWVDVVFSSTSPFGGPVVTTFTPANGSATATAATAVTATFNEAIDPATLTSSTFQLRDAGNNPISAALSYNSSTFTVTLQPNSPLVPSGTYTAVLVGGTGGQAIRAPSGVALAANVTWSFAIAGTSGCPCMIWPASAAPGNADSGDATALELGVRFRSDLSGYITGVRFYKSAGNTGTHTGNLWSNDGTLLATGTFNAETGSGWQELDFSSPVAITAGTTYVASYYTSAGHYAYDAGFFAANGVDNTPLHALADNIDGSNGVYTAGPSSAFPSSTFGAANYWVDVVFSTVLTTPAPVVTSASPANGAPGVATGTAISVTFNIAIDPTTLNSSTFVLLDQTGATVPGVLSYNAATFSAKLQPSAALVAGSTYTVFLPSGGIKTPAGGTLAAKVTWSFATASASQPPVVTAFSPASAAKGISTTAAITATFSKAIDSTTLGSASFQLLDASNNLVSAVITYNNSTLTATLQPSAALSFLTTYTVTLRAGLIKDTQGNGLPGNVTWSFTTTAGPPPPPSNCPCTLWSASTIPSSPDSGDNLGIEVGVKFTTDIAGYITGIRFYKSALNLGTHVGNLWSSSGTRLATATFTIESATGWQQVNFSSPVAVAANTTYVASYYAPQGHYGYASSAFTTLGVDNGVLHALAKGVNGDNGVFTYGAASTFPTTSYNSSNYWVDVVYVPSTTTNTPSVISSVPAQGTTGVSIGTLVSAAFSEPMNPSSINVSAFSLVDAANNVIAGTVSYDVPSASIVFTPNGGLQSQTTYTATVAATATSTFGTPMGQAFTWSFTTALPPANSGPGGPILVISSAQNPFTRYLQEILLNEGLNEFTVQDISTVTAATLSSYDIAILGDMSLAASQVSMLTSWVNGGGRLIAMHPDKQLAGLLGLTSTSNTLSNQYLTVNTATGPGVGIVADSIQFHGTADIYNLNGATSIATLFSSATTSANAPAVSWVNVGAGQAAAFTYDLAKSVIFTRQGNPAWSGQQRNVYVDPTSGQPLTEIRSDDLFYGAASFDPQPDWIDLNKVIIPQADEQQRLLANLIQTMNASKKPLPHFWYFPSGFKAVVIMTGDDHNNGGTTGRFDQYVAASPAGCSVADWTCVRATSYVWTSTPLPNYQSYISKGFEIANHTDNDPTCTNWTPASLESAITEQLGFFAAAYPGIPTSKTNRTHCILWSDYDTEPQILYNHGIRLDTSYYYWPAPWIQDRPGVFTGSGMPMRYADRNGNTFDVYQAVTQMPDESLQTFPMTIDALLDNALGANGFYGAFTANMHNDEVESPGSDSIVQEALARGVPIVSSLQMLTWLDGRNTSSFSSMTWNGGVLSFTVVAGTGSRNLMALVPATSAAGKLRNLTLNGSSVSFTLQTIKGIQYAMFGTSGGAYQATYAPVFTVSGTISGPGANGATVSASGTANATTTADSNGNYVLTGLFNGSYVITPFNAGYTFTPGSQNVTVNGANVSGVNFNSIVTPTYSVSGTITGAGGSFATITVSGTGSATTVADASGNFSISGLINGSYTLTPSISAYNFTPTTANVTVNGANITGVSFTSTLSTSTTLAIDVNVSADQEAGASSITSPTFSTKMGNELLLAFVSGDNPGFPPATAVTSITGGGLTWQLVQQTNDQLGTAEIWRAFAPAPLANVSVKANLSPAVQASLTVLSFTGVDVSGSNGSGAIGAVGSASDPSAQPSASLVTTRSNSWVFGVGNDWDSATARTVPSGQSLVHQFLSVSGDTYWVQMQNAVTPTRGTTVRINDTAPFNDQFNLSIVEVLGIRPPVVSLSPTSEAFGIQQINTTSTAKVVTLSNTGDGKLLIGSIAITGTNPSDFAQTNNCGTVLAAQSSCTISVTFKPLATGSRAGTLAITDNASGSPHNVTLTGTGTAVSFSPTSLTFGGQNTGTTSAAQVVTVTNVGTASLTAIAISFTGTNFGDYAQTNNCGTSLAPGANCTINVTFKPTATGTRTATLRIADSDPTSPQQVTLTGTGTAPVASLSPTSVSFGIVPLNTASSATPVTLRNTGTGAMTISSISITGSSAADFTQTNTCGTTLAPGSNCTINVTFTPSATGTRSGTLSVADNASGSPHTASLSGTGTGVTYAPTSLAFGSQNTGTTSAAQVVTLTNVGTTTLTSVAISFTGTNLGDFAQTNNCGTTLAAGANCTINVTFKPTATGSRSATLRIGDSDPTTPQLVTLTGTGTTPVASLSPTSVSFGILTVNTASSATPVTLRNTGTGAMTISSISITGTNAADFAQTNNCGATLAAGSNCTINVTFTPSATGTRSGTLSVADNASGSPHNATLSGTGTGVTYAPTSLAFGSQNTGTTSAAQVVTLTNIGTTTLTSVAISLTGTNLGDFAQTNNCGTSLAAGANCTISVTFKPTATGSRSASLRIGDSDPTTPQLITLTGTGTAPVASLSPTSVSFGTLTVNTASSATPVTLRNTGTGIMAISSISITGTNAADFTQTNNCGTTLAAGSNCTINVTFTPSAAGTRSGTLSVADNASGSPHNATLSGTGTGVTVSPSSLTFAARTVGTTSPAQVVTLTNVGTTTLTSIVISLAGTNPGDYAQTHTCEGTLAAGASCTISVTFKPTFRFTRSATLRITDSDPTSPQQVTLTGTGQ